MEGQQSTMGSFTETVNVEQESSPNSSGMNPQSSSSNMLNSADSRLSNNPVSSQASTCIHSNAQDVQSLNWRNFGESGSRSVLSSSCGVHPGDGHMTEERQLEPSYFLFPDRLHSASNVSGGSSSNNIPLSVNRNARQVGSSGNARQVRCPPTNNSEAAGRSSGSFCADMGVSSSSMSGSGLAGKRRALEGTSGHARPAENNFGRPVRYDAPRNLRPSLNPSSIYPYAYLPQRLGVRGVANLQQYQSAEFTTSSAGIPLHSNLPSFQPSLRPVLYRGSMYFRAATPVAPSMNSYDNHSHASHLSRNMHPRTATSSTRARNSSYTDRNLALQNDSNVRGIPRNNMEHPMRTPATEMRNELQRVPTDARVGPSSSIRPLRPRISTPPHNTSRNNQQRILEPSIVSTPSGRGGSVGRNNHQLLPQLTSLRLLPASDEERLLLEVQRTLNAYDIGELMQAQDSMMLIDPTNALTVPTHDRHREMRLETENMSYEDLLALGERIGIVNTGLNEGTILEIMKQHIYSFMAMETSQDMEPCCICQEEYREGDAVGRLACGHDFHTKCIKEWLMLKNKCPICTTQGLDTRESSRR